MENKINSDNKNKYGKGQPIRITIFANPINQKESVMIFNENIIEGWGFAEYAATGCIVLNADTFDPLNLNPHTLHIQENHLRNIPPSKP